MEKLDQDIYEAPERYFQLKELEEYIISLCLHNDTALAACMTKLDSHRDFQDDQNAKAYRMIEHKYQQGEDIDGKSMASLWVDLSIFEQGNARYVLSKFDGDTDYEPKIDELKKAGVMRKAQRDITKLRELTQKDVSPDKLISEGLDMVMAWNSGATKKYLSVKELEELERNREVGEKLRSGRPILDDTLYEQAGQNKGTVKATVFREKHGKTRHACWEVAQDIRQGHKVLYITLEGTNTKIKNNIKQVLQHQWDDFNENLFFGDCGKDLEDITSTIIEACFIEDIDKVVVDYLQRMEAPRAKYISENENFNVCSKQLTDLCVRYNFNLHIISQPRSENKMDKGWNNVPSVYDVYGSKQLVKDASIILIGFRPKWYEELHAETAMGKRIKDMDGNTAAFNSVYLKPVLSREKLDIAHRWLHFRDSDEGYQIMKNELI